MDMNKNQFDRNLSKHSIIMSLLKYFGFLFVILFFSIKSERSKKYHLLIDDIQSENELERWKSLNDDFGKENIIFISKNTDVTSNSLNIFHQPSLRGYSRKKILSNFFKLLFSDPLYLYQISRKSEINMIFLVTHFFNDYFYYYSLFNKVSAKLLLQDRNLGTTNPIKNYLFKKRGGEITACLQKNIAQHNGTALFYDIDIFFSYGNKTAEDITRLGARINKIIPIGSMSMSNALPQIQNFQNSRKTKYDVLFIGLNTTSPRTDWKFNYESIKWLVKMSKDMPNLRIAIKHHATWQGDKLEQEITNNSNIEYISHDLNTYSLGFKSKLILTYGSSMGYEFIGLGRNVRFLDPGNENPFINNFVYKDNLVINSYFDLKKLIEGKNELQHTNHKIDCEDYCYNNHDISKKIISSLKKATT
tara:strand:- start:877 stop:2130 length:1254 start_codon:yes stop_codon:yes gene_type:complete